MLIINIIFRRPHYSFLKNRRKEPIRKLLLELVVFVLVWFFLSLHSMIFFPTSLFLSLSLFNNTVLPAMEDENLESFELFPAIPYERCILLVLPGQCLLQMSPNICTYLQPHKFMFIFLGSSYSLLLPKVHLQY